MNSINLTDGYKLSHSKMYPEGTTLVYCNFTPRNDQYAFKQCQNKGIVVFGIQMALKYIHDHFAENFFKTEKRKTYEPVSKSKLGDALYENVLLFTKKSVMEEIKQSFSMYLGSDYDISHFEKLWDLGYLPIEVRGLEEGTICPIKVPVITIHNTHPDFFWLPNFLETILSSLLWKPMTSATIAKAYKEILLRYAYETDRENIDFVSWQGHDFSMRGMDSVDATVASGLGHLTSFLGTDSLPTLWGAKHYYLENDKSLIANSVPATEHSVMCAGTKEDEIGTFKRLLNLYPTGILSVVSDTWDLWKVCTEYLPKLKEEILTRDGKLVIRPDSGDPVDILCGTESRKDQGWYDDGPEWSDSYKKEVNEERGVIQLLWDTFGGTINEQGYKVLDPHIGAIYGDSITLDRAEEICKRLKEKGFASTNVVFGIGSYTYQYNTRDTFGFAMKATYIEKETRIECTCKSDKNIGCPKCTKKECIEIFKDPVTDSGLKKSAKGLLKVIEENGTYVLKDQVNWHEVNASDNALKVLYKDGVLFSKKTLQEIREILSNTR